MKRLILRALERLQLLLPAFRLYERAKALPRRPRARAASDGLPLPPPALIVRVAGEADPGWFIEGGRLAEQSIRAALARQGSAPESLGALLDFGCGCGRVLRRWHDLQSAVHGSDFDERAIAWCRAELPFARCFTNGPSPPLDLPAAQFDLVYALSVFTHLAAEAQAAWFAELARVLRPGGLLLLSTHGQAYSERLTPAERERFAAGELVVRWQQVAGTNLCSAYHPRQAIDELAGAHFELLELVPEGAAGNPHQDLSTLRRR